MKLNVQIVLCIVCFSQIRSGSTWSTDEKKHIEQNIRNDLKGVSDRLIDDVLLILEKYEGVSFVESIGDFLLVLARRIQKNENTSKIDVDGIKNFKSNISIGDENESVIVDNFKVLRSILSKQLPPDRYNGITNLAYVLIHSAATDEEMESALSYLYGTGTTELKDFTEHLPTPNATDCPQAYKRYSAVNDKLKSMTDIQAVFRANFATIIEKFPCNTKIRDFLEYFMKIVVRLRSLVSDNETEISACNIEKESHIVDGLNCSLMPDADRYCQYRIVENEKMRLKNAETILSARLADEDYRELISFVNATVFDKKPLNELQRSLEYVFTDVAPMDCSTDFRELINFIKATLFDKMPLNEVQRSLEYVFTDVAPTDCSTE